MTWLKSTIDFDALQYLSFYFQEFVIGYMLSENVWNRFAALHKVALSLKQQTTEKEFSRILKPHNN